MRKLTYFLVQIIILIIAVTTAGAQESTAATENTFDKKFGLSVVLQSEQLDLLFPIWPDNNVVIIPSISIVSVSDISTDFGYGLGLRYNLKYDDATPYIGARVEVLVLIPKAGDSFSDIVFGPFAGGEYFFSEHFSVSVEAQLNVAMSDEFSTRFGNPDGTNVNTATVALATFYF